MKYLSLVLLALIPLQSMAGVVCGNNAYDNPISEVCLETNDSWPVAVYLKGEGENQKIKLKVTDVEVMDQDVYKIKIHVYADGDSSELVLMHSTSKSDYVYIDGTVFGSYDLSASLY